MQGVGLVGQLPLDAEVWGPLRTLQRLNLADNELSGYLPPQMEELTNLEYLTLSNNSMSGGWVGRCVRLGGGWLG
jgi:hypothetical protein